MPTLTHVSAPRPVPRFERADVAQARREAYEDAMAIALAVAKEYGPLTAAGAVAVADRIREERL